MIERMVILTKGSVLTAPPAELEAWESTEDNLTEMERDHIIRVLRETNGVLSGTTGAASRLGVKRTTLQSMLKRFGIEAQNFRRGNGTFGQSRNPLATKETKLHEGKFHEFFLREPSCP